MSHAETASGTVPASIDPSTHSSKEIPPARNSRRRIIVGVVVVFLVVVGGYYLIPIISLALRTASTDDAYINGHFTFVAPRVSGQVAEVLVDDNVRVSKGELLVVLDREPYQIQVDIKKAAVINAEADLRAAEAQVRGTLGLIRSQRWKLQTSIEQVDNQVALLRARVATLRSKDATLERAKADLGRAQQLFNRSVIAKEELDQRREAEGVAAALVHQATEEIAETRVSLGLPPRPESGDLSEVPRELNQTFSGVRQSLAEMVQSLAQVGLPLVSTNHTPSQAIAEFVARDKEGNIDRILDRIVPESPPVRQAMAKQLTASRDLAQAELNLRYCEIRSEIDGVVTRRNVNAGNNVQAGQSVMAVRSLTEIWIDANFKETQLADIRIGHRVEVDVDMYGDLKKFRGRVTGFTMGTGQTLAVLPAQNATGNFVKVVQRLPVRIELENYDPERETLFTGLSVTPYVFTTEKPDGPGAGKRLQDLRKPTPSASK